MTKLSGYTVAFERTAGGLWGSEATDPEGRLISALPREAGTKAEAERRALHRIERHARRDEIDGETLWVRVLTAQLERHLEEF